MARGKPKHKGQSNKKKRPEQRKRTANNIKKRRARHKLNHPNDKTSLANAKDYIPKPK